MKNFAMRNFGMKNYYMKINGMQNFGIKKFGDKFCERLLSGDIKLNYSLTDEEKKTVESVKTVALEGVDVVGKTTLVSQLIQLRREALDKGKIVELGKFTLFLRSERYARGGVDNVCFVKLAYHGRIYKKLTSILAKKEVTWEGKLLAKDIKGFFNAVNKNKQEMFNFFYNDYISTLKKLARIIKEYKIETLIFDRCWLSNYAYNTTVAIGHEYVDALAKEVLKDKYYKLRIHKLFYFDKDRLNGVLDVRKKNQSDFYESDSAGGMLREIIDKSYSYLHNSLSYNTNIIGSVSVLYGNSKERIRNTLSKQLEAVDRSIGYSTVDSLKYYRTCIRGLTSTNIKYIDGTWLDD